MDILQMNREELIRQRQLLEKEYEACRERKLCLDMSRGKPGKEQLDLSEPLLTILPDNEAVGQTCPDVRNYGELYGIAACRKLFAEIFQVPWENVLAGGNSSLTMMYDTMLRLWVFGPPDAAPWSALPKVRWLCPVPGYDRHFAITEQLGMEMIPVPMNDEGPDMDKVESLVQDASVKGIWCVPKYANPEGVTYSDRVVRRLAEMKTAAPDFRIFWDNAYIVHDLYDEGDALANVYEEALRAGTEDRVLMFTSTSKVTYPGAGVAALAASPRNIRWTADVMKAQAIGPDKVNQLRHVLLLKDRAGVEAYMKRHAAVLRPKFDVVLNVLEARLADTGAGSWHAPRGGYFVSFHALPGCAKRIHQLCKEAGVTMTGAGATWPYGKDPEDSNLRIAPSFPPAAELKTAMEVFCTCALLAAVEKRLEEIVICE